MKADKMVNPGWRRSPAIYKADVAFDSVDVGNVSAKLAVEIFVDSVQEASRKAQMNKYQSSRKELDNSTPEVTDKSKSWAYVS